MTRRIFRAPESTPEWQITDQPVVLVDENDVALGIEDKRNAHIGGGRLHRAFMVLLFDPQGNVLLSKRSRQKILWPGWWGDSCASHPFLGESLKGAVRRRLAEELGVSCGLQSFGSFSYRAAYRDIGVEHEYCHVFVGMIDQPLDPDPNEVECTRFVDPFGLVADLRAGVGNYVPWLVACCQILGKTCFALPASGGSSFSDRLEL